MSSQPLSSEVCPTLAGTSLRSGHQHIRVGLSPIATLATLSLESVGRYRGSPAEWPQAVRAQLEGTDVALLASIAATKFIPDCVLPLPDTYAPTFEQELERVASTPPEALTAEICEVGLIDAEWAAAARAPRRWLRAYVAAMERAWIGTKPLWSRATALLERETERVGSALAKGALDVLFNGLHPRGRVEGDQLYLDYDDGVPATLAPGMVMVPMIAGAEAGFIGHDGCAVFDFCYPLPGVRRVFNGNGSHPPSNGATLDALVGEPRAAILRRLDVGLSGHRLSGLLQLAPSAIAHHIDALERAGLVRRERQGRNVIVHRSGRGSVLLALYE